MKIISYVDSDVSYKLWRKTVFECLKIIHCFQLAYCNFDDFSKVFFTLQSKNWDVVVILGCGPVGQFAITSCKLLVSPAGSKLR